MTITETTMTDMKIGIVGCAGRMGQMLVRQVAATAGCLVAGGTEAPGSAAIGKDVAAIAGLDPVGAEIGDDPAPLFAGVDAVIDFTSPDATVAHAALAAQAQCVHVVGTTGLDAAAVGKIERAAAHTPIVMAANMSVGVNLLAALVRRAAAALGDDYDIEIVEMHHRHKVDAPSGTALMLGHAAADGRGVDFDQVARLSREGITGERPQAAAMSSANIRWSSPAAASGWCSAISRARGNYSPAAPCAPRSGRRTGVPGSIRWQMCWGWTKNR